MFTTRFLDKTEYFKYEDWLKSLDRETLHMFFGYAVKNDTIHRLVGDIVKDSKNHNFLIAEDCNQWIGIIHIAETTVDEVEFGIIVHKDYRKQDVADTLMHEAIIWARNRGYHALYMHCLSWNHAIKRLCAKHGLLVKSDSGESETKMALPPATPYTWGAEMAIKNRNIYKMFLQKNLDFIQEIYG